jgi:hypothetical protein
MHADLATEIAALPRLRVSELRARFAAVFGVSGPRWATPDMGSRPLAINNCLSPLPSANPRVPIADPPRHTLHQFVVRNAVEIPARQW